MVKNLYKVPKVDGPHQGLKPMQSPQSRRTPPRVKNLYKVQKVDGPNKGRTYITPKKKKKKKKKGWTDPTDVQNSKIHKKRTKPVHKIIQVHKVDGHQGSRPRSTE